AAGTHRRGLEDVVLADPPEGILEHLLGVGLEYDALTGTPSPNVDLLEEALREFPAVVARVALRAQVDVALRAAQRAEIFLHVLGIGVAGEHRGHHERAVDDLAEAELLEEVVGPGKQRRGRHLAVDQLLQPRKQDTVGKRELDGGERQVLPYASEWTEVCA